MKAFKFNWQKEPEGLWKWILPHLLSDAKDPTVEELSDLTNQFEDVEISVFVNGVEMDAKKFFEGLETSYDREVERGVSKRIKELPGLNEAMDLVYDVDSRLRASVRRVARNAGIDLDSDN